MGITDLELFAPHPPLIDGTFLPHCLNPEPNADVKVMEIDSAGQIDMLDFAEASREPKLTLTTYALGKLLNSGSGNLNVDVNNGLNAITGNTVVQYRSKSDGGGFNADTDVHFTITAARAYAHLVSIKAKQDEQNPATAEALLYMLTSSGGTDPDVIANDANVSGSVALADKWCLGPIVLNGTTLGGVDSIDYQTGIECVAHRAAGNLYPATIELRRRKHQVTLGVKNMGILAAQGFGLSNIAGNCDVYLRHISAAGGRTAGATTSHIRLRFTSAKLEIQRVQADGIAMNMPVLRNTGTVSLTHAVALP